MNRVRHNGHDVIMRHNFERTNKKSVIGEHQALDDEDLAVLVRVWLLPQTNKQRR
jgi:hypothetical protein